MPPGVAAWLWAKRWTVALCVVALVLFVAYTDQRQHDNHQREIDRLEEQLTR